MRSWKISVCPPRTFPIIAASSLSSVCDGIRSPSWHMHVRSELFCNQSVERKPSGTKDKNQHRCKEKRIRSGSIELVWIGEDGDERIVICSPECDEHGTGEQQ